jgi:hypothetical protein
MLLVLDIVQAGDDVIVGGIAASGMLPDRVARPSAWAPWQS